MGLALPSKVWEKFVSGEICNFQNLYKEYYKGLYGYGLKICNDTVLVEDCIQDLFESIWIRRKELGHITSPNVYLYVSLRRKILLALKKQKKMNSLNESVEILNIQFETEEIIITRENTKEHKKELQKALNKLTNQQKEVIYLHFYNGMSYSEIEEILSINRQSVRNHMYQGMKTLRSVLNINAMRLVISIFISVLIFT